MNSIASTLAAGLLYGTFGSLAFTLLLIGLLATAELAIGTLAHGVPPVVACALAMLPL